MYRVPSPVGATNTNGMYFLVGQQRARSTEDHMQPIVALMMHLCVD